MDNKEDPSIRRLHSSESRIGEYFVIAHSHVQADAPNYVAAETKAHDYARKNPNVHVMIAQVTAQVIGKPHVYEVKK
jgi:hypothetical protein